MLSNQIASALIQNKSRFFCCNADGNNGSAIESQKISLNPVTKNDSG
jgi:hypothetical protein